MKPIVSFMTDPEGTNTIGTAPVWAKNDEESPALDEVSILDEERFQWISDIDLALSGEELSFREQLRASSQDWGSERAWSRWLDAYRREKRN